jgi:hypothetical protein
MNVDLKKLHNRAPAFRGVCLRVVVLNETPNSSFICRTVRSHSTHILVNANGVRGQAL